MSGLHACQKLPAVSASQLSHVLGFPPSSLITLGARSLAHDDASTTAAPKAEAPSHLTACP